MSSDVPDLAELKRIFKLEQRCKEDLKIIKSLANPPQLVKDVLTATCIIIGALKQPCEWRDIQKQLANCDSFVMKMKNLDKDNIPTDAMSDVRTNYLNREDFDPEHSAKVAAAAKYLCEWLHALDQYDRHYKNEKSEQKEDKRTQGRYAVSTFHDKPLLS